MMKLIALFLFITLFISGCVTEPIGEVNLVKRVNERQGIQSFEMPDNLSEEMKSIIALAWDYLDVDKFTNLSCWRTVDNELFYDFAGGTVVPYRQMLRFYERSADTEWFMSGHWDLDDVFRRSFWFWFDYYLNLYIEAHLLPPYHWGRVFFKMVDIFNDGEERLVIGHFDQGSPNHTYTEIYHVNSNDRIARELVLYGNSGFRVVHYNGINFLIYPSFLICPVYGASNPDGLTPLFHIVLFINGNVESVDISERNGVTMAPPLRIFPDDFFVQDNGK